MTTIKGLAIVSLLVSGTSLAMAQTGPATGQQPTAAPPAPSPSMRSAAPPTGAVSGTRMARQTIKHPNKMSAKGSTHKGVVRAGAYGAAATGAGYYGAGYGGGYGAPFYASATLGMGGPGVGMGAAFCHPTFDYTTGWNERCPGTGFVFGTGQIHR